MSTTVFIFIPKNAMNIKLACGSEILISGWGGDIPPTIEQLLASAVTTRPGLIATWCDEQARLPSSARASSR